LERHVRFFLCLSRSLPQQSSFSHPFHESSCACACCHSQRTFSHINCIHRAFPQCVS
jgi:hypothetical protein